MSQTRFDGYKCDGCGKTHKSLCWCWDTHFPYGQGWIKVNAYGYRIGDACSKECEIIVRKNKG